MNTSPPTVGDDETLAQWLLRLREEKELSDEELGEVLESNGYEPWDLVYAAIEETRQPKEVWAAMYSDGPEDSLSVLSLHQTKQTAKSAIEDSKAETRKWLQEVNAEAKRTHAELNHPDDYDPTQTWEEFTRRMAWDVQQLTVHE